MIKKLAFFTIVAIFLFSTIGAYAQTNIDKPIAPPMEKTKDRASRAMNNMLYGPTEVPKNLEETKTKGAQVDRCIPKTQSGVERGIARVSAGLWQLATFWYSDPGCVTATENGKAAAPAYASAPASSSAAETSSVK